MGLKCVHSVKAKKNARGGSFTFLFVWLILGCIPKISFVGGKEQI